MSCSLTTVALALWLGILTSISPCPMATNIAAMSYIGRQVATPRHILLGGLLYTLGRTLAYVALGVLLSLTALSIPGVSHFLQKYMNVALGPLLILTGMVLLDLLTFRLPAAASSEGVQRLAQAWGLWSSLVLGALFAMSFCPASAALFFGSLLPLAAKTGSRVCLPAAYGIGTALPALVFAVLVAAGAEAASKAFEKLKRVERWVRWATGGVFVIVGIYMCLAHIFHVL